MTREVPVSRYAWLSLSAAVLTVALKLTAWAVTGSVGLLSDALESLVNILAAAVAIAMLRLAARPPDEEHQYGHYKAEYFASGLEGMLIAGAALMIGWTAWRRLISPVPLEQPALGLATVGLATLLNLGVARIILRAGRRHDSITLEANARHLLTDVWTSLGVIVGVGLVALTGWLRLDPIIAIAVALHILVTGWDLLRRSALGMLDTALDAPDREVIQEILARYQERGVQFHALRTRKSGGRRFVSMHVLVPGEWTVAAGHELLEEIEADVRAALDPVTVFTHLEPIEDPASWVDTEIERRRPRSE